MEEVFEKIFKLYDNDNDGFVDFSNFAKILSKLEVELLANYPIQRNYATLDINNFPDYTLNELTSYIQNSEKFASHKKECGEFFEKLDEDKDGIVRIEDLKSNQIYAVIFNDISKQEINLEEFTNILIKRLFQTLIDKQYK
ncbi:hypothetical protein BpHYR1_002164 [Brachionus plicatilis]|uniref:EF-hand domain-containing protein n=1 Tax=Brachionus plicatilis TaxID=10195 RepID=A0A3M7Q9U9_BRAPC|nr:hypothetical protein BpHYR1_002164 [Brachionus plicatilis]